MGGSGINIYFVVYMLSSVIDHSSTSDRSEVVTVYLHLTETTV